MRRTLEALAIATALCALLSGRARADIPSSGLSTVGARLVVCPAGDSLLLVIVRDGNGSPWLDGSVVVDCCSCPGFHLVSESACATLEPGGCRVATEPDGLGVVEVPLMGGGLCPGGTVKVVAGGVPLAIRGEPACFDQNGDLRVDDADAAIVTAKLGASEAGADFDGDGVVSQADLAILGQHMGHVGPGTAGSAGKAHGPRDRGGGR